MKSWRNLVSWRGFFLKIIFLHGWDNWIAIILLLP
jgi:hypothetical protein